MAERRIKLSARSSSKRTRMGFSVFFGSDLVSSITLTVLAPQGRDRPDQGELAGCLDASCCSCVIVSYSFSLAGRADVTARTALANSGNLLKTETLRNHCLLSMAGYPLTSLPASTSFGMPD